MVTDILWAGALAVFSVFVLVWAKFSINKEMRSFEREINRQGELLASLTRRVYALEKTPEEPSPELLIPLPLPLTNVTEEARPTSLPESRDWETVVGTSWLNRAGALLLVVGVALFLGYSFRQLGAFGRLGIGLAAGLGLLVVGVAAERTERYLGFSISLIAAAWAILYFTAYAASALPQTSVIADPLTGLSLLLGVAVAMVAHSLRYRSEPATALGFFFAFAAFNVSAATPLTLLAAACLAAAALVIAIRFGWSRLAASGVVLTYGTYLLQASTGHGIAILWLYWGLFEAADLLALARKHPPYMGLQRVLVYGNACGFFASAMFKNWNLPSTNWVPFFVSASAALALSSYLRFRFTSFATDPHRGGYKGAAAFSAIALAGAILHRFTGVSVTLALILEGQAIFLSGVFSRNSFLRRVGGSLLAGAFVRLSLADIWSPEITGLLGLNVHKGIVPALLMSVVLCLNRWLSHSRLASAGAALCFLAIIAADFDADWGTVAGACLISASLLAGLRWDAYDLRILAYASALLCCARAILRLSETDSGNLAVFATCTAAASFYIGQYTLYREAKLQEREAPLYLSVLATLLILAALYYRVEGGRLTVAIAVQAGTTLATGFISKLRILRITGLVLFLLCIGKVFLYDLRELDTLSRIFSFIGLGLLLLAASWVYTRFKDSLRKLL